MPNNFVEQQSDIPDVTITIGEIEALSPNPILDQEEANNGVWQDYAIVFRYERDKQRWMMPVCSPNGFDGDNVSFVQLAGETLLLIVDWSGMRAGPKPTIPLAEWEDPNWILLDDMQEPGTMQKKPSGEIVWRHSGTYVYGCKNPSSAIMHYGRPPWLSKSICCEVEYSQYVNNILEKCCEAESTESEPESGVPDTEPPPEEVG